MNITHDFRKDLQALVHEVRYGSPFAFVRFGDGERAIMEKRPLDVDKPFERWSSPNAFLSDALERALRYDDGRYFVGVSCPCCDLQSHQWYMQRRTPSRTTYANLFVNGNHESALPELKRLLANYVVVSSAWGADIRVPRDATTLRDVGEFVSFAASEILRQRRGALVAAGPMGKAIIHAAYQMAKSTRDEASFDRIPTMIDVGSSLDTVLHGAPTRCYHEEGHPDRERVCHWSA